MAAYDTNLLRAALGIGAGVIAGAGLVTLASFWGITDFEYLRQYWVRDALVVFIYAAVVWAAGLIVVAPVPWVILHRYGMRNWWVAVALGALLTFVVVLALASNGFGVFGDASFSASDSGGPTWAGGRLTAHGWAEAARLALYCCVAGALVGFVVWRTAYRRVSA